MVFVILIVGGWCGVSVASTLPGGSLGGFLATQGITLSYFNSLLVGLILALAITPTIFSVAEEAIHSVPQNLSSGALALGSTPWQSYRDIVLPLAMPGMIAAVMIGFGRAAGETVILLMLSGNAGVIDSNIFEGLRSVSASLALELPEAPRNSSHYHVLFVMGLLLFACTFAINTAAELIKDRVKASARGV
jgi:phosphate transport system permease protein